MLASPESKTIWPALAQAAQAVTQQGALRRPPDEVGEPAARRLEAALRHGDVFDHEGLDWLGKALGCLPAEVAQPEQIADEAASGAGEDDLPGFRKRLQARREIGGLTCDRLLLRRALADQIADDDQPGGNADADGEPLRSAGLEPRHGRFYFEPRPHRPLGVVVMRPRIAEIGQYPVAHVFGDKAVIARDDGGDGVLIGSDLLAQFLGVKPHRQGRRADEIAEHHCQLPPLGVGESRSLAGCNRRGSSGSRGAERSNRGEQFPAMADRGHADADQVVGR
jgi:hypothetical protein